MLVKEIEKFSEIGAMQASRQEDCGRHGTEADTV